MFPYAYVNGKRSRIDIVLGKQTQTVTYEMSSKFNLYDDT